MDTKFFQRKIMGMRLGWSRISSATMITRSMTSHVYSADHRKPRRAGVEIHYLGLPAVGSAGVIRTVENTGFRANPERTPGTYAKYSSIDDKIDMFHYFTTLIKFGIGRATYDAAQEVRNGKITREEAVHLVRKYDQEFPQRYYVEFLEYIGLSDSEFWETVDQVRSPHLWKHSENGWALRHIVD